LGSTQHRLDAANAISYSQDYHGITVMAKNERPITLAEHLAKARAAKAANEAKMTREQMSARTAVGRRALDLKKVKPK
jgi:hypothetical protein